VRFAPFTLCLSAQGPRWTDPTIAPAFDGLKISVSRRVTFIDRSLLGSSFLGPRNEGSTGVSVHRGFRSAPQSGGYGALVAPSTEMSRITLFGIYMPVIQTSRLRGKKSRQGSDVGQAEFWLQGTRRMFHFLTTVS
jgi:hypothetical protein